MNIKDFKNKVQKEVDGHSNELISLSLKIHDNPETSYKEVKASGWLTEYLANQGFIITRNYCNLPTAFKAVYGSGRPAIAFIAEYDALAEVGHACGHNIIATASVGAAIAVKGILEKLKGSVLVIGTPAEETDGGKVIMVERGGFNGVDAAMMIHPARRNTAAVEALACIGLEVEFIGKSTHASSNPEGGINALEAMLLSFNSINSLRQHIKEKSRIHGIITKGGEAPNIVPAYSSAKFLVRAENDQYLDNLCKRVLNCFKAASRATGAKLKYKWADIRYSPLYNNKVMTQLFTQNMEMLGRKVQLSSMGKGIGSTDMGNVSKVIPSIHPTISIASLKTFIHSPEFAKAACSEKGNQGVIDGAKVLAMTAVDLLADKECLKKVKSEFDLLQRTLSSGRSRKD
ncbi:MAG: M20 family metallopeptidase [Chloroflexi bacterium]|nr:M20 family metallopeptidase [Chloroflexota bacterium]